MTTTRYPFTVDQIQRGEHGYWTATLTIYGDPFAVDRRFGSWRFTPEDEGNYRDLPHRYAVTLQERVRRLERAEARSNA